MLVYFYNVWIIATAWAALASLIAGLLFFRLNGKLAKFIALMCFSIAIETGNSAINLGAAIGSSCQVTNHKLIGFRLFVRIVQAVCAILFMMYATGFFREPLAEQLVEKPKIADTK